MSRSYHEQFELENAAIQLRGRAGDAPGTRDHDHALIVDRAAAQIAAARVSAREGRLRSIGWEAAMAARTMHATSAAGDGSGADAIAVDEVSVTIGDVRTQRRRLCGDASRRVPSVDFVPMASHVRVLRELLIDWSLGSHLLLLGDQGVGKNKLADKLLELLRAEREYLQLHRWGRPGDSDLPAARPPWALTIRLA